MNYICPCLTFDYIKIWSSDEEELPTVETSTEIIENLQKREVVLSIAVPEEIVVPELKLRENLREDKSQQTDDDLSTSNIIDKYFPDSPQKEFPNDYEYDFENLP